jgi:chitinase
LSNSRSSWSFLANSLASIASLAGMAILASCANLPRVPVVSEGYHIPADFKVVGYFPSWSGDPKSIQYQALTHVCYAFAVPTFDGDYQAIAHEDKLYRLMALAHDGGARVILSFGGWNDGKPNAYDTIASDPGLTERFAARLLDLCSRYNLDGIDIDWEFPKPDTAAAFADFIHALALRLHAEGKLLSIAVSANGYSGKNYLDSVIEDVDFINIMAYDDGYGEPPGKNHSTYAFAREALDYWIGARNAPRDKAILGVPFYGRSLSDRRSISYYNIHKGHYGSASGDEAGGYGKNGFDTIRAKVVNQARLRGGGIMIWQLNQDANGSDSLLNLILDTVKEPDER